jgi:hypothetical protein
VCVCVCVLFANLCGCCRDGTRLVGENALGESLSEYYSGLNGLRFRRLEILRRGLYARDRLVRVLLPAIHPSIEEENGCREFHMYETAGLCQDKPRKHHRIARQLNDVVAVTVFVCVIFDVFVRGLFTHNRFAGMDSVYPMAVTWGALQPVVQPTAEQRAVIRHFRQPRRRCLLASRHVFDVFSRGLYLDWLWTVLGKLSRIGLPLCIIRRQRERLL